LADDETERGDLRGEYGDGGRYLKEEVYPCETEMVGSSEVSWTRRTQPRVRVTPVKRI
jgi:hypothetical protein